MVKWLRLYAPTAEGIGSGWGTKIPHALCHCQIKKKKNEGIKKELKERKEEKSISESWNNFKEPCKKVLVLQPARLLCPWDFSGKSTGVGSHSLLQGIFLTLDQTFGSPVLQADSLPSKPLLTEVLERGMECQKSYFTKQF